MTDDVTKQQCAGMICLCLRLVKWCRTAYKGKKASKDYSEIHRMMEPDLELTEHCY